MRAFDDALKQTLGIEGPESDRANDPGGKTRYGISKAKHPEMWENGPPTYDQAVSFYKVLWNSLSLDVIAEQAPRVAGKLFDIAVNTGEKHAAMWLQVALNAFNQQGVAYHDIDMDGAIGPVTLSAFHAYMAKRAKQDGADVLHDALSAQQGSYYLNLRDGNPALEDFEYGWFKDRVAL